MALRASFQTYGVQYSIDPVLLAAQGYQESELDLACHNKIAGGIALGTVIAATAVGGGEHVLVVERLRHEPGILG